MSRPPALVTAVAAIMCATGPAFAQGKTVADLIGQCAACHGKDGNAKIVEIPSLAGQPEFFLLNQLFLMREGVRRIPVMMPYVKDLTDADIEALASHFAKLESKASDEEIDPALITRGQALAETHRCASCHLPAFEGRQQMPRLAGQRVDYLIHSMTEYRDNERTGADTLMSNVVVGLSDADLAALAHYAASRGSAR